MAVKRSGTSGRRNATKSELGFMGDLMDGDRASPGLAAAVVVMRVLRDRLDYPLTSRATPPATATDTPKFRSADAAAVLHPPSRNWAAKVATQGT